MREVYSVEIRGVRPYLMSAYKGEENAPKRRKVHPTVEQDCEKALYRREDGQIYVPAMQIEACMKAESTSHNLKGRTSYWATVTGGVTIEPDQILMNPQTFKPFVTPVRIPPRTGTRIMKGRPQFDNWSLKFNIVITDANLSEAMAKEILTDAGQYKGIGDWRPKFGLYEVASWKKEQ